MTGLTHFDQEGNAHMVDVGGKIETERKAVAIGTIQLGAQAYAVLKGGSSKKGDVLGVARIAAIQGAKRTSDLIPLCHPLPLTRLAVDFELDDQACEVHCTCTAQTVGKNRGRNGSPDRCSGRASHHLRHAQGD